MTLIGKFTFTGALGSEATYAPDAQPTGATISDISRGAGILGTAAGGVFNSNKWEDAGDTGTLAEAIAQNEYYEFSITSVGANTLSLTSLSFLEQKSAAAGLTNWELRSSLDGFAAAASASATGAVSNPGGVETVTLGAAFTGLSGTTTFRFYAYGTDGTPSGTATWRLDDVQLFGTISASAPTPQAPVIAGFGPAATLSTGQALTGALIDASVSVSDSDTAAFAGGEVSLAWTSGSGTTDRLSIRNQGVASGQIGVAGATVTFGGATIGTITSDGTGGTALTVSLVGGATPAAVAALLANVTYQSTAASPAGTRAFAVSVRDGTAASAGTAAVTLTVEPPPAIVINEVDADQTGSPDTAEFIELKGPAGASLDGFVLTLFNGSNGKSYRSFDLDGQVIDANGYFVIGNVPGAALAFPASSDVLQQGVDAVGLYFQPNAHANDTTDRTTNIVDAVVYRNGSQSDGAALQDMLTVGGVLTETTTASIQRIPDGAGATRDATAFKIGGLPTPGAANSLVAVNAAPTLTGFGPSVTFAPADVTTPRTIDDAVSFLDATSPDLDTGVLTLTITAGGTADDRLSVLNEGGGTGQIAVSGSTVSYSGVAIGTLAGGTGATPLTVTLNASATPVAVDRLIERLTYQSVAASPSGTRTLSLTVSDGDGLTSTASTIEVKLAAPVAASSLVINEFVRDHSGSTDANEFIEIKTTPNADLSAYSVLAIEGDVGSAIGQVDRVYALPNADANGYAVVKINNQLENGALTLLLVKGFTGAAGTTDIDGDNDGIIDATAPWTQLVDSVAVTETTDLGTPYSETVLMEGFGNSTFEIGGASRIPNGADTNSPADWIRNTFTDPSATGTSGFAGTGQATNSRGLDNKTFDAAPSAAQLPVNTAPSALTIPAGSTVRLSGFSVSDPDGTPLHVQLTTDKGLLSVDAIAGGAPRITGVNTGTITLQGTPTEISATLAQGLAFTPTAGFTGVASLTMVAADGLQGFDRDTTAITVDGSLKLPVNTVPAPFQTTAGTPVALTGLAVTDADSPTVTVVLEARKGVLSVPGGAGSGGATVTVSGTLAAVNAALAAAQYTPTEAGFVGAASIRMTTTDNTNGQDRDDIFVAVGMSASNALTIQGIQGATHRSGVEGAVVSNIVGAVTAKAADGFYLQAASDGNIGTSDGVFVFTGGAPAVTVGDAVKVAGTVREFQPIGDDFNPTEFNLTITQIDARAGSQGSIAAAGAPISIAPTDIGPSSLYANGRMPETETTSNGAVTGVFDPVNEGIDFWESVEGMLMRLNDAVAISNEGYDGEVFAVGDNGSWATGYYASRSVLTISAGPNQNSFADDDFNPERIAIYDKLAPSSLAQVTPGAKLGTVTGVISYGQNEYQLQTVNQISPALAVNSREVTTLVGTATKLTVANMNLYNLDPSDATNGSSPFSGNRFTDFATVITTHLLSPDVISVQELQDNDGETSGATVSAAQTAELLIDAVAAAGGPAYRYFGFSPVNNQEGGAPGANIRVGFFYRADRVALSAPLATNSEIARAEHVDGSGLIALPTTTSQFTTRLTDAAFDNTRRPLSTEFTFLPTSDRFYILDNHWPSRIGSSPQFGSTQPALDNEVRREAAAASVNALIDQILATDANARIISNGDLNTFGFASSANLLMGGSSSLNLYNSTPHPDRVLYPLDQLLPPEQRYSYIFDGNAQALDHAHVSPKLWLSGAPEVDEVHINTGQTKIYSDHDPIVARVSMAITGNVAPTLVDTPLLFPVTGVASGAPTGVVGAKVSELVKLGVNMIDANPADLAGIAIAGTNAAAGTWWRSLDDGATWATLGPVSAAAAVLLPDTARLYLQANGSGSGTIADALTFYAWDRSSGTAGGTASVATRGGTTAFSQASDVVAADLIALNTAPTLSAGARSLGTVLEDAVSPAGVTAQALIAAGGGSASDAQTAAANIGIALTGVAPTNGRFEYRIAGGPWTQVPATVSPTAAVLLGPSDEIRFVPNANYAGPAPGTISFVAWDRAAGTAGETRTTVGSSLFSTSTAIASATIVPVNDAPTVAAGIAGRTVGFGAAVAFDFPTNAFADVDDAALTYDATGLPGWLTFDALTRTFSGAAPTVAGASTITVKATDGGTPGLSASTTFTVTVVDPANLPVAPAATPGSDSGTLPGGIATFDGGAGLDAITLGAPIGPVTLTGVETVVGSNQGDRIVLRPDNPTRTTPGAGADQVTIEGTTTIDRIVYQTAEDGAPAGQRAGFDRIQGLRPGDGDRIVVTGTLAVDADDLTPGNGALAAQSAGQNGADLTTAELIFLARAVGPQPQPNRPVADTPRDGSTLSDAGFASLIEALGTVRVGTDPAQRDALLVANDGTNTGLYWIVDANGDGAIGAGEVTMLALFVGTVLDPTAIELVYDAVINPGAPPTTPAAPPTTPAGPATPPTAPGVLRGTPGPDRLVATPGNDTIAGEDGNDVVEALGGDDIILSGRGIDQVSGGAGLDRIEFAADLRTVALGYVPWAGGIMVAQADGSVTIAREIEIFRFAGVDLTEAQILGRGAVDVLGLTQPFQANGGLFL